MPPKLVALAIIAFAFAVFLFCVEQLLQVAETPYLGWSNVNWSFWSTVLGDLGDVIWSILTLYFRAALIIACSEVFEGIHRSMWPQEESSRSQQNTDTWKQLKKARREVLEKEREQIERENELSEKGEQLGKEKARLKRDREQLVRQRKRLVAERDQLINSLREQNVCVVCMDKRREFLLKPCNHYGVCSDCIRKITLCPTCRTKIRHSEKIYYA